MTTEPTAAPDLSGLSYAEGMAELERIVAALDDGEIDIDRLGEEFQRAVDIAEELSRRISDARTKVERMAPRLERVARPSDEAQEG